MTEPATAPSFKPGLPTTQSEATTAIVHFYRAEVGRMSGWRDRLDRTTNWAITVVAALLSVSLSTPSAHHGVLVFAMLLISLLLYVESRRYRFYDVYRMRVRQFERHYFGQLFSGTEGGPEPWLEMMSQELRHPMFRIDMVAAVTRRLKRNYIWLYAILLLAWVLKITSPKLQAGAGTDAVPPMQSIFESAAFGPLPGWLVIGLMLAFYVLLTIAAFRGRRRADDDEVHV